MNSKRATQHLLSIAALLTSATAANAAWSLVENFESLSTGAINGQNGWTAGTNVNVAADPATALNQVGSMATASTTAWKTMGSITTGTATTGLQRRKRRRIRPIPRWWCWRGCRCFQSGSGCRWVFGDFRTQMGVNPGFGDTITRPFALVSTDEDGAGSEGINRFPVGQDVNPILPDVWYEAWTVMNNTTGEYQVYLQGGSYTTQTLVLSDVARLTIPIGDPGARQENSYDFRNDGTLSTAANAIKFFARTGTTHQSPMYFDDIWYDASGTNLAAVPEPSAALLGLLTAGGLVLRRRRRA